MKTYIYISGFVTGFLLLGGLMALLMGIPNYSLMLGAGLIALLIVYLPLVLIKRKKHRKRMDEIIRNYQQREKVSCSGLTADGADKTEKSSKNSKGWSMNNSPYRERKSGLTWGSGNIHAANASRGTRKHRK